MRVNSYMSGPRWAGVRSFLYEAASATGVRLVSVDSDKGLLTETVYFDAEGEVINLRKFARVLESAMARYNR